ncbi:MAG TPA: SIS domain-containing protein, partial [Anaerolineaceae bacterium]|nr:SIS domain-containing protein [Anaerolineaceae bacterium]
MIKNTNLYKEIHEQPLAMQRFFDHEWADLKKTSKLLKDDRVTNVVIAARGTSDNAARYAQYLFGAANHLSVGLATPSLHSIYQQVPSYKNSLVIGISQSGKSPDIVSVIADAKKQGSPTIAITNEPDSDLARIADCLVDLHAGPELSVAATKTYTTELAAIAALSTLAADDPARETILRSVPELMQATLQLSPFIAQAAERYRYMRMCVVIGRGFNYPTAFEVALKIKELNYIIAEPYSSADFLHGPVAVVEEAFPVLVIAPSGRMLQEMQVFVQDLHERGAEIIAISDDEGLLAEGRTSFRLPHIPDEWVSPLVSVVPGQLFAMHLADVRDLNIDHPRGLHK